VALATAILASCSTARSQTNSLADQADAIVVGQLQTGQQNGNSVSFVLSVARSAKGNFTTGATINVSGACCKAASRSLQGQYGLWFLKKAGSQWTFLPVNQGGAFLESSAFFPLSTTSLPASLGIASGPSTVYDQVAVELATALQSSTDHLQFVNLASGLLGVGASAVTSELYSGFRASPDPQLRFLGLTGLWGAGDVSALTEIADNADQIPGLYVRQLLGRTICSANQTDPPVIAALGKLAASPTMQACAAMTLMYIHTVPTLPFLAQLLDSDNALARECAIRGFSRFVDNLPVATQDNAINAEGLIPQGPAPYRTAQTDRYSLSITPLRSASFSEAEYLTFWKSWWATMGDTVMQGGH
jgi:hypothetical protein